MSIKKVSLAIMAMAILTFGFNMNVIAQEHEHEEENSEESGKQYSMTQTYNEVNHGVKLILKYDKASSSFKGTMENTTKKTAEKARVEIHLSNGVELGPTKAVNIKPGKKVDVKLSARGQKFETWSAHAEIGSSEHTHSHGDGAEHSHDEETKESKKKKKK